jgi:hypothetical protein
MKDLDPKATVNKELFPKLFSGEYGAEISMLQSVNISRNCQGLVRRLRQKR